MVYLWSAHPEDENSFDNPTKASAHELGCLLMLAAVGDAALAASHYLMPAGRIPGAALKALTPRPRPAPPRAPQIAPAAAAVDGLSSKFVLPLKPWSVNILQLRLEPSPSPSPSSGLQASGSGGAADVAAA